MTHDEQARLATAIAELLKDHIYARSMEMGVQCVSDLLEEDPGFAYAVKDRSSTIDVNYTLTINHEQLQTILGGIRRQQPVRQKTFFGRIWEGLK